MCLLCIGIQELEGVQTPVSGLDMKPPRRLYDGGFMVVLHDMNPSDHSQILPISHMKVYLISIFSTGLL
jgi:hypothetical protein